MRVPLLDLQALHAPLKADLDAAWERVVASGHFALGPEVAECEREIAAYCNAANGIGVSSGSDALLATLLALGIGPGDEVVTTAYSFFASSSAIVRAGARPVWADMADDFNVDVDDALARVTAKTKLILTVDLFGKRSDVARLGAAGVPIVEDAAQAVGAPGLCDGTVAATLSFFPSKNLGALGDGGMVLTHDAQLADRVRLVRQHGSRPKYTHNVVGGNFRLDALQAAFLRVKLRHLDGWTAARRKNAQMYIARLGGIDGLRTPDDAPGHVWHQFVVRVAGGRRDGLRAHLAELGVETEVYYPSPLHTQPAFRDVAGKPGDHPRAEAACHEVLALPVHPTLSEAQIGRVCEVVRRYLCNAA